MSASAPEPPESAPADPATAAPGRTSRRRRGGSRGGDPASGGMIPARAGRSRPETLLMRLVATAGIVGISVAIAAIMGSQKSQPWLIGLVVSIVSVILAAILWSSRRL